MRRREKNQIFCAKQSARTEDSVKFSTNSAEGFRRLFKASVRSTHIHVSGKHMESAICGRSLSGPTTATWRTRGLIFLSAFLSSFGRYGA
jgi:hypothetical protein